MRTDLLAALAAVFLSPVARADAFACRAKVAQLRYDVTLDTATGAMTVVNNDKTSASGAATRFYDGVSDHTFYFLATGFGQGLEIDMQAFGANSPGLCFSDNECYGCPVTGPTPQSGRGAASTSAAR